jgi:hypothetical protein
MYVSKWISVVDEEIDVGGFVVTVVLQFSKRVTRVVCILRVASVLCACNDSD